MSEEILKQILSEIQTIKNDLQSVKDNQLTKEDWEREKLRLLTGVGDLLSEKLSEIIRCKDQFIIRQNY